MTNHRPLPPLERLNQLFEVVPIKESQFGIQSGLIRKIRRGGNPIGSVVGSLRRKDRGKRLEWKLQFEGKYFIASRIVYYMSTNVDPGEFEVDHEDRNTLNNNKSNLRLGTQLIQGHNRGISLNNTSGVSGVCWHEGYKKWWVSLTYKGVLVLNEYTPCKIEAARIRNDKIVELGLYKLGKPLNNLEALVCGCFSCECKRVV